jgi:hypothetical protein
VHDGNPVLAWMIGNVVGHYDAKENVYPHKERPENKIDGGQLVATWWSRDSRILTNFLRMPSWFESCNNQIA